MTKEFTGNFQPAFNATVCKPTYLQGLQHLQVYVYQRARVCAQECKSPESAESAESAVSRGHDCNSHDGCNSHEGVTP